MSSEELTWPLRTLRQPLWKLNEESKTDCLRRFSVSHFNKILCLLNLLNLKAGIEVSIQLHTDDMSSICDFPWPGNIESLKTTIVQEKVTPAAVPAIIQNLSNVRYHYVELHVGWAADGSYGKAQCTFASCAFPPQKDLKWIEEDEEYAPCMYFLAIVRGCPTLWKDIRFRSSWIRDWGRGLVFYRNGFQERLIPTFIHLSNNGLMCKLSGVEMGKG